MWLEGFFCLGVSFKDFERGLKCSVQTYKKLDLYMIQSYSMLYGRITLSVQSLVGRRL